MESEGTQVLGDGIKIIAKQLLQDVGDGKGKWNSRCSDLKSPVEKLRKRKRAYDCSTSCSQRVGKSTVKYYSNFMKSSLPDRILFFENGQWNDFPPYVVESAREHFKLKNAAIQVEINGSLYLLDILYMVRWDLETGTRKQIAWIDEEGRCFFPEILLGSTSSGMTEQACPTDLVRDAGFALQLPEGNQEIKLHLQIDIKGAPLYDLEECVEESNSHAKKIKLTKRTLGRHVDLGIDRNLDQDDQASYVNPQKFDGRCQLEGEEMAVEVTANYKLLEPNTVRDMFLSGMQSFGCAKLLEMIPCSDHLMKSRMELFAKQVEITTKNRGDPNVRYAWLAADEDAASGLMMYGLGAGGYKRGSAVHLTPIDDPHSSARNCAANKQGLQYLVLCRVILGNVELIDPTSCQFHPSSQSFDNGVDNLQNPHLYIVWSMNASTHIFPEYLITFEMTPGAQGTLSGKETSAVILGKTTSEMPIAGVFPHRCASETEGISPPLPGHGKMTSEKKYVNQDVMPSKVPKSPWMPFPLLFEAISKEVTPKDMETVNVHYKLFLSKKITRDEFIKKLRSMVGDGLLRSTILSLQRKQPPVSSFYPKVPKQEQNC